MATRDGHPLAGRHVLLGVTGGIAAYKAVVLLRGLVTAGAEVQVVMTPAATRFVGPDTFAALSRRPVHSDLFERTDVVLHVLLAHQAEVAVVAPATANVLARLALGLADDLLSSTLLEASCPLVVAPAMHTGMWSHPATRANLETLRSRGVAVVDPETGPLAAGDEGVGRMAEPEHVLTAVIRAAGGVVAPPTVSAVRQLDWGAGDLKGLRVLVTAGPTFEPIDAVRYLGNRSSGKMGFAVAREAARRGAAVTVVSGPVGLADPEGIEVLHVETSDEMAAAVLERFEGSDVVVMAAAVADFKPGRAVTAKLKKDAGPPELDLQPTTDILALLGERKGDRVLVGFAAETDDPRAEGRRKLKQKHLDMVVVNEVGRPGTGFGSDTNRAAIYGTGGPDAPLTDWTKADLATAICDRIRVLAAAKRA